MPLLSSSAALAWSIPLIAATGCVAFFVIVYNGLVQLRNDCDRAWSNIDVLLKQRYDEIPNLVRVCKAYIRHERETLVNVINARQIGLDATTTEEVGRADAETRRALTRLFAVAEKYPDLKANERFAALETRISGLESEIADRREYYNACVTNYNVRIEQVPDVFVARNTGFTARELLRFRNVDRAPDLDFDDTGLEPTGTA